MRTHVSKTAKAIAFVLVGILIFGSIPKSITTGDCATYNYEMSAGFFAEPNDALDVVYIGASPTFTSWVAPVAYKKYGIVGRVLANDGQPFVAAEDLLRIARKGHPSAVYFICINGLYESCTVQSMHRTTDFLPRSLERGHLICNMRDSFQYSWEDWIELEVPIVRYHSRWSTLDQASFHPAQESVKGGFTAPNFLNTTVDISEDYRATDEREPLLDFTQTALMNLLDYCGSEHVKAVFVLSAQYRDEKTIKWYNTMLAEIKECGFPLVNELEDFDKIGLDDTTDFYNAAHTNIHGALKITDYLSQYLLAHYDFPKKSGGGTKAGTKPTTSIKRSLPRI